MKNHFTNNAYRKLRYLLLVSIFMLTAFSGFADHFRYGNITWEHVPGNPYQIKFKVFMAYKRSYYANASQLNVGALRPVGLFYPGTGTNTAISIYITAVNYTDDWFYGEWSYTHTYPSVQATYQAYFAANAYRLGPPLMNNPVGNVHVGTSVQVGGVSNDAPVAIIQPIINVRENDSNFTYQIPAVDPNGDSLTFSLTPAGAFGAGTVHPSGLTISPTGLLQWSNPAKTSGQYYNTSIRITDSKGAWCTLDFLLKVVGNSTPSGFDYAVSPANGTIFEIQPGDSIMFQVKVSDVDSGDSVKLIAIGVPPGGTFTVAGANPAIGTFSWKPNGNQEGDYVINIISEDNAGVQNNTTIFLNVSYKPKFNVPTTPGNNSVFTLKPGDTISHEVAAYHPDSNNKVELTQFSGIKPGMTFTPAFPLAKATFTGTNFTWVPSASDWGINQVIYKARDTIYSEAALNIIYYMVDNPPVITSVPDSVAKVGVPYTYVLNAYDVDTIYGDKIKLEIAQLPSFLTATPNGNNSWIISGTPGAGDLGTTNILLEVADSLNHIFGTHAGNAIQMYTLSVVPPAGGLHFDGNAYVNLGDKIEGFGPATFEAWIYRESPSGSGFDEIISKETVSSFSINNSNNKLHMNFGNGASWGNAVESTNPIPYNQWVHVAATRDAAGIVKVYVNGVLEGTGLNNNIGNNAHSRGIGTKPGFGSSVAAFNGKIDELRVWNRALCADELNNNKNCELQGVQNGLSAYYKFNQGFDGANNQGETTLTDASGNNNGGTLTGFALTGGTSNWVGGNINGSCNAYIAPVAIITAGGATTVCHGSTVTLTANSGSAYQWAKDGVNIAGANAQSYAAGQSGSYTVAVTNASGCTGTSVATAVTVAPQLTVAGVVANATIFGTSTGSVDVTANGGTSPYSYAWSNSTTSEDAANLAAGNYTVTVTDDMNCTESASFTVSQPAQLVVTGAVSNATIYGTNNGGVDISVSGGVGPYTYSWSNNATTEDVSAIGAGTYTVTVTDANGATATGTYTVTEPAQLLATASVSNALIYNTNTGGIDLSVTGGVGPYTYSWSNNATTEDVSGLGAGTYTVTVTDANGAMFTATYTVTQPAQLTVSGVVANATIFGMANGGVDITPAGGVGPYTYSWSNSTTTEDLSGIGAGTYTVTVTDANGATASGTYTVTQPSALNAGIAVSPVTTVSGQAPYTIYKGYGLQSVTLTASATGGVPGYTYSWSPATGLSNANIANPSASPLVTTTYTVTVTDANGAVKTVSKTIYVIDVKCSNNKVKICHLPPGNPGNPQQMCLPASAIPAHLAHGCYLGDCLEVYGSKTNISCNGDSNGAVNLTVTGGVPPYSYSWSNGATTEDISGVAAGTYTVTVTAADSRVVTETFTITQPSALNVTATVKNACYGSNNGSINQTVTGGTWPYSYNWSNSNCSTQDRNNLAASTYTVVITDAKGCSVTRTYTISQPSSAIAITGIKTNVSCKNGDNGAIDITVAGGEGPYTYSWNESNSSYYNYNHNHNCHSWWLNWCSNHNNNNNCNTTTQDLSELEAGMYVVTVTDANGCTETASFTITEPSSVLYVTGTDNNVSCKDGNNGSINVSVWGGSAPYTYSWNTGDSTQDLSGLVSGTYVVTVTDAAGCVKTKSFNISEPSSGITATALVKNTCSGSNTGSINQTVTGGTWPYSYNWTNSSCNTQDRTGLAAGTYTVLITDSKGCSITKTYTISAPSSPMNVTAAVTHVTCNNGNNGAIDVTVTGGSGPYTYNWDNSNNSGWGWWWFCNNNNITTQDRNNLEAGTYTLTVTDAGGCETTVSFTVNEPAAINPSIAVSPVVTVTNGQPHTIYQGYGPQSVTLTASATGGTAPYTYSWSGSGISGSTNASVSVSPTSTKTYTVTITDAKGCTKTESQTIKVIDVTADNGKIYVCHNGNKKKVSYSQVAGHLAHGDNLGDCDDDDNCNKNNYNKDSEHEEEEDENEAGSNSTLSDLAATNINVYPNPSNGSFTIELPAGMAHATVFVMDMSGKIVDRKTAEDKLVKFDLSNVAKGAYMITVKSGNEVYNSRVSIQ